MRIFSLVVIILFSLLLSSCDYYLSYIIKKTLEGNFSYVKEIERKYKLRGDNINDIPISEEEKIVYELSEERLFPSIKPEIPIGSKLEPTKEFFIQTKVGKKEIIELPSGDGFWFLKRYTTSTLEFSRNSDIRNNRYEFLVKSPEGGEIIFWMVSSNGNVEEIYKYKLNVTEVENKEFSEKSLSKLSGVSTKFNTVTNEAKKLSQYVKNSSADENISASTNAIDGKPGNDEFTNSKKFDVVDNEKEVPEPVAPSAPSGPAKLDLATLVGNEKLFFEEVDIIAQKYGYYKALKEIEKIETNVSDQDLPKIKLKKIEMYEKLGNYKKAIEEGQNLIDKDNAISAKVAILLGKSGKEIDSNTLIKQTLSKLVTPQEIKLILHMFVDYLSNSSYLPTREIVNAILQKNEFISKNYQEDYFTNLLGIAFLYERVGDYQKANSIYEMVIKSSKNSSITNKAFDMKTRMEEKLEYR